MKIRRFVNALALPLGALVLILAGGALANWSLPVCRFFEWTHLPCPACGVTRSLAALARLHLSEAWRWHPLAFGLVLAAFAQPLLLHRARLGRILASRRAGFIFAALVFLNWIYLCRVLPG